LWKYDLTANQHLLRLKILIQLISEENIRVKVGLLHTLILTAMIVGLKALTVVEPIIMIVEYNRHLLVMKEL
jgi:hypothetical protein